MKAEEFVKEFLDRMYKSNDEYFSLVSFKKVFESVDFLESVFDKLVSRNYYPVLIKVHLIKNGDVKKIKEDNYRRWEESNKLKEKLGKIKYDSDLSYVKIHFCKKKGECFERVELEYFNFFSKLEEEGIPVEDRASKIIKGHKLFGDSDHKIILSYAGVFDGIKENSKFC